MEITLPADLQTFVDSQLALRTFPSVDDLLAQALRRFKLDLELRRDLEDPAIRKALEQGFEDIAAGRVEPMDLDVIHQEVKAEIARRRSLKEAG